MVRFRQTGANVRSEAGHGSGSPHRRRSSGRGHVAFAAGWTVLASLSLTVLAGLSLCGSGGPAAAEDGEVNIYSYRQPELIQPLLDRFTAETGIRTNVVTASAGLEERIAAEGEFSPADILLSVDVGRLENAKALGITQPIVSRVVNENIPAIYRDPEGGWVGLTMRARVFYASRERVKETALDYEDLVKPEWKGRLCTRSGQHVYNIGLIASLIANDGMDEAEKIVAGIRDNLAMKPSGDDRAQAKAIWAGECDLALGNTYYVGLMETDDREPEQKEWAKAIRVIFPNEGGRGTQVNISGVVLAKNAPNKANALKLIEFLTSDEAQELYADANFEYPVRPGLKPNAVVQALGTLKPDPLPLSELAKYRKAASELVDKVDFDAGPSR
ncbi:iron(III) transport system substrate-binding protein [Pseudoxanthobacter soli DSM 19599]|uniref:Iron(III) transport system substrate-binding protein n=1 Tax=Pseudoxanthobacter soli DSM 19599 TaxID=1123029 RepID=A0A1M7ZR08_9HYPH|nr:iron(III) transport system substrate-binding protein [Pseudoxanthobacter soli DSM 19599]